MQGPGAIGQDERLVPESTGYQLDGRSILQNEPAGNELTDAQNIGLYHGGIRSGRSACSASPPEEMIVVPSVFGFVLRECEDAVSSYMEG